MLTITITGDSMSGKSFLAKILNKELKKYNYKMTVIDDRQEAQDVFDKLPETSPDKCDERKLFIQVVV